MDFVIESFSSNMTVLAALAQLMTLIQEQQKKQGNN